MKKVQFTVTIEFADSINSDNDIHEIMSNVAGGLHHVADHQGLAPEDSDTHTYAIKVHSNVINESKEIEL